ncbi:MAG: response regulator, partial [Magnetospirillum sp.]|nr:response regulator [Magnetospirillum sp.]
RPLEPAALLRAISRLTVRSPIPPPQCSPCQPRIPTPAETRPLIILVAEDHPVNQQVILRQLRILGHEAQVFPDGAAALDAWRNQHWDVVITDCHMPVMDGFQFTAAIRAEEKGNRHVPVLALTANALTGESDRCLAAGMDGYLSKPVELARLREALDRVMAAAPCEP